LSKTARIPSLGSTAVSFPIALAQSGWARSARVKMPVPEPILPEALTKDVVAENARHILDDIDGVTNLSGYLLTDVLKSFGRIRRTSSSSKRE
jgi:hypothetical protein